MATNSNTTGRFTFTTVDHYINGAFVPSSSCVAAADDNVNDDNDNDDVSQAYLDVVNPATLAPIGRVAIATNNSTSTTHNTHPVVVEDAVSAAHAAFPSWSSLTIKSRASIMMEFHSLIRSHANELADLIVMENGKNKTEALADIAKGNETVEYACSMPQLMAGNIERVSTQVTCYDRRDALGVVASIVPFNFPFMVPMWSVPVALVTGNTLVLKPSEKVPLTMRRVAELLDQAGVPKGVFNMVQGTKDAVEGLIDHPLVRAVTFVGSSPIAKVVSNRCRALNKRCTALGGAKNHLVALEDCDIETTASDVVVSYAGCAGQRCMAASVLLLVGCRPPKEEEGNNTQQAAALLTKIVEKASAIEPGTNAGQMGPVIDERSYQKILKYIEQSESDGAKILLDGRSWIEKQKEKEGGYWIGPTIICHENSTDPAMKEEVFGPVLSVHHVATWEDAVQIENSNPFGNAAAIYTTHGGHAEWFLKRFRAAMLGVNIGIPVPREPFSFGGLYGTQSKYGDMDITGDGGMEFFTNRIKVTSKWPAPQVPEYAMGLQSAMQNEESNTTTATDHANFAGRM